MPIPARADFQHYEDEDEPEGGRTIRARHVGNRVPQVRRNGRTASAPPGGFMRRHRSCFASSDSPRRLPFNAIAPAHTLPRSPDRLLLRNRCDSRCSAPRRSGESARTCWSWSRKRKGHRAHSSLTRLRSRARGRSCQGRLSIALPSRHQIRTSTSRTHLLRLRILVSPGRLGPLTRFSLSF
jgi:hypothetical protein